MLAIYTNPLVCKFLSFLTNVWRYLWKIQDIKFSHSETHSDQILLLNSSECVLKYNLNNYLIHMYTIIMTALKYINKVVNDK